MWFQHGKLRYNSKFDWSSRDVYLVDVSTPDQLSVIHKMIVNTSRFNKLKCSVTEKDLPCVIAFEQSPYTKGLLFMDKSQHMENSTRAILYNRPMFINKTFEEMFTIVDPTIDDDCRVLAHLLKLVNKKKQVNGNLKVVIHNNYELKKINLLLGHFKCNQYDHKSISKPLLMMLDHDGNVFWAKDVVTIDNYPNILTLDSVAKYEDFENTLKECNEDLVKAHWGSNLDTLCKSILSDWFTETSQPISKKQEYNYVARTKKGDLYLFKTLENPSNENWYACDTDVRLKIDNSRYQDIANNTCKKMLVKE